MGIRQIFGSQKDEDTEDNANQIWYFLIIRPMNSYSCLVSNKALLTKSSKFVCHEISASWLPIPSKGLSQRRRYITQSHLTAPDPSHLVRIGLARHPLAKLSAIFANSATSTFGQFDICRTFNPAAHRAHAAAKRQFEAFNAEFILGEKGGNFVELLAWGQ